MRTCACGCGQPVPEHRYAFALRHGAGIPCIIDGCGSTSRVNDGLCRMHQMRWERHRDPLALLQLPENAAAWFAAHVIRHPSGCWEWSGAVSESGYGTLRVDGRKRYVHRWSYEQHVGPIPDGLLVRHKCDNPPCANPAHLEVGTPAQNVQDMWERGRASEGERHSVKLTADDVRSIRARVAAGETLASVSADCGISVTLVWQIANRRSWKSVA